MNAAMRDFAIRSIGCIACWKRGIGPTPCDKHHLLTTGLHGNGKRRGERFTIGLCTYHHQGEKAVGTRVAALMRVDHGPSYGDNARDFRAEFGTDDELLAYQNELIEEWRKAE